MSGEVVLNLKCDCPDPKPWKDVKMLSSLYTANKASILYEGINTAKNKRMRVSEHITFENGKIAEIQTVISQLG